MTAFGNGVAAPQACYTSAAFLLAGYQTKSSTSQVAGRACDAQFPSDPFSLRALQHPSLPAASQPKQLTSLSAMRSSSQQSLFIPAALELKPGGGYRDLIIGPTLQCLEAATLGMPFEVWKTYMGRNRSESTFGSLHSIYSKAGGGLKGTAAFWRGTGPKMVESASKGAILMVSKEAFLTGLAPLDIHPGLAGALAGAGGGACQVTVMGPCTYLVTGAVTGDRNVSTMQRISRTWAQHGVRGFYPGGTAIAIRQMTNWASRQGFTEAMRNQFKLSFHGTTSAKLTKPQEVGAGILGGILACWNHPFEVARIEMQARGDQGQRALNIGQVFSMIVKEQGVGGLFTGIVPRVCLGIWQTLFMVTGAKLVQEALAADA